MGVNEHVICKGGSRREEGVQSFLLLHLKIVAGGKPGQVWARWGAPRFSVTPV